jgi:hypothetical protein
MLKRVIEMSFGKSLFFADALPPLGTPSARQGFARPSKKTQNRRLPQNTPATEWSSLCFNLCLASAFAANQLNPRKLLFRINIAGRREVLRPIQCGSGNVDLPRSAAYLVCERTAADLTKRSYRTSFSSIFLWLSLFECKI